MTNGLRISSHALAAAIATSVSAAKPDQARTAPRRCLPYRRASAAAPCDCATAANHGQFVRCAGQVVKGLVASESSTGAARAPWFGSSPEPTCGKAVTPSPAALLIVRAV